MERVGEYLVLLLKEVDGQYKTFILPFDSRCKTSILFALEGMITMESENILKYKSIMSQYRSGKYGNEPSSMHEILERAGEADLFDSMSEDELQQLADTSSCIFSKQMLHLLKTRKSKCTHVYM